MARRHRIPKEYEGDSIGSIIKDNDSLNIILNADDYAYYDTSSKRWRAGRLNKQQTGRYLSKRSAKISRSWAKRNNQRIFKAKQFKEQRNVETSKAWKLARDWKKDYNNAKKFYPQPSDYTDELYSISYYQRT